MTKRKIPQRGIRCFLSPVVFTLLLSWISVAAPFPDSNRAPILVLAVLSNSRSSRAVVFCAPIPLLRLLPDPIQHPDASAQFGRRNIVKQFVSKLERLSLDLFNHTLSARCQLHCLPTTILRRIFSRYPTIAFQAMQYAHQTWLFNAHMRGIFGMSSRS